MITDMLPSFKELKKYIIKKLLPAIVIIIVGISFLNFFLAYRLENFLKVELGRRTSEATGGFYKLAFDDLSINLLNGELRLDGVVFVPDSAVFIEWNSRDSLPLNYVNAYVGAIDFKGINLIWRRDYRQLNFHTFEIASPDIRVYDAYNSGRHKRKTKNTTSKTLHELIEPYIDVLTVGHLKLENVSASFTVEDPSVPIIYALKDVTFHGYDFRLDSTSYERGKLLYCDDFEFITNHSQRILSNRNFILDTDSIRLSTRDSIIYFRNIELSPHETTGKNVNYLDGDVEEVIIKRIGFKRREALNYLHAGSLEILNSDVMVYDGTPKEKQERVRTEKDVSVPLDSIVNSISLYEIVSPILHQVSINYIGIEEAKMGYSVAIKDTIEHYRMENFTFHAWDFLIDSVAEREDGLWYAQKFNLEASDIYGLMTARNHRFRVDKLLLDTEKGEFRIENARIHPLSVRTRNDYLSGKIDTLFIEGLEYDNGISADRFVIESPSVSYSTVSRRNKTGETKTKGHNSKVDVEDIFNSLFRYLHIEDIRLNRGNISVVERNQSKPVAYKLNNFWFFATNFLMNENTWKSDQDMIFTCEDYGFRFTDFDNYLPGENYRLSMKKGFFSTLAGRLELTDVKLSPKDEIWNETPGAYVNFESPLIRIKGFNDLLNQTSDIKLDSLSVESPDIRIIKSDSPEAKEIEEKVKEYTPFSPFHSIDIGSVKLNNTNLAFRNKSSGENLDIKYDLLSLSNILWNTTEERGFDIEEFIVKKPDVKWEVTKYDSLTVSTTDTLTPKTLPEALHPYAESFRIHHFYADDIHLDANQPYLKAGFDVSSFSFDSLYWNFKEEDRRMEIATISIQEPDVQIQQLQAPQSDYVEVEDTIKKSLYDQLALLGDRISVGRLEVSKAELDYEVRLKDTIQNSQKLNNTNFIVEQLKLDNKEESFAFGDVHFSTDNLVFPINNGFYDMVIGHLELNNGHLKLDSFHMVSPYPKTEFAYLHPNHKDWFDVSFRQLEMDGINLPAIFSDNLIQIKNIRIDDPVLLNYKNKKIPVPAKWMPMIYTGLQKAPVKIDIEKIQVNNFGVVYEEISRNGKEPGKLVFTELNGTLTGVTNIVSYPDQYFILEADGKFYGKGHFNAVWLLPVDSLNDRFILTAHLPDFDLIALNEMITPLASAELKSGYLNDIFFTMDAGGVGGSIDMLLLYQDMKINIFQEKDGVKKDKKFLNLLVNAVVRDHNPRRKNAKPKEVYEVIVRDPYHSSFNYLWQLLRPALAESVGVTKTHQNIAMGIVKVINKVKGFLGLGKKKPEPVMALEDVKSAKVPE